ncbi:MAG: HD domain-containing phosphohydrolase [Solirubrobacterales bacterium]
MPANMTAKDEIPVTKAAPTRVGLGERARVLVTDDRPEMLRTMRMALGEEYECVFAGSVEEARERLAERPFQLALCDVHAAGELALALAEEILAAYPGTAVILATDEESPTIADRAFELGVHGYLVEPFWPGQLLITVVNALRWRRLEMAKIAHNRNLRASFQTIIDNAPFPIYAKDSTHRYVVSNVKADELAGLRPGSAVGETDSSFMDRAAAEAAEVADKRIFAGGDSYDAEERIVIDGVEKTFKTIKFPLVDENLEISALGGISIDITAEKEEVQLRDQLAASQRRAIEELRLSREETVDRLARAIDLHDASTGEHVNRIGLIAAFLASKLGLDAEEVELLRVAAPMHDVGKIGIADEILRKPGPLSAEERAAMERHTLIGHEILSGSESRLLQVAATIALTHHERFDGSGYPYRTRGEDIPLEGRITAVVDVFDALLSDRCYRPAMETATAVQMVEAGRGTQFDPRVVDALMRNLDEALATRS